MRSYLKLAVLGGGFLAYPCQACPHLTGTYRSQSKGNLIATTFVIDQQGCESVEIQAGKDDSLLIITDGKSRLLRKPHNAKEDAKLTAFYKGDTLICKYNWNGGMVTYQSYRLDSRRNLRIMNRMTAPQNYTVPEITAKRVK